MPNRIFISVFPSSEELDAFFEVQIYFEQSEEASNRLIDYSEYEKDGVEAYQIDEVVPELILEDLKEKNIEPFPEK